MISLLELAVKNREVQNAIRDIMLNVIKSDDFAQKIETAFLDGVDRELSNSFTTLFDDVWEDLQTMVGKAVKENFTLVLTPKDIKN